MRYHTVLASTLLTVQEDGVAPESELEPAIFAMHPTILIAPLRVVELIEDILLSCSE